VRNVGDHWRHVEIFNSKGQDCPDIPDYPISIAYPTVAYIDGNNVLPLILLLTIDPFLGQVVACGGEVENNPVTSCYALSSDMDKWRLLRFLPEGPGGGLDSSIINNQWIISGDGEDADYLYALEDNVFVPGGPKLPAGKSHHCQVTVNDTHLLFTAGSSLDTFLLDLET